MFENSSWSSTSDITRELISTQALVPCPSFSRLRLGWCGPAVNHRTFSENHKSITMSESNSSISGPSSPTRRYKSRRSWSRRFLSIVLTRFILLNNRSTFALVKGMISKISITCKTFSHSFFKSLFSNTFFQIWWYFTFLWFLTIGITWGFQSKPFFWYFTDFTCIQVE